MSQTPPPTKLLIVASSLWIGGAETVINHLSRAIDRRQFKVTVCYLKQLGHVGQEMVAAGVDVVGISDSAEQKVDYFTFRKLLRIVRSRQIDVVHTHTTHGLVDAALCKLLVPRLKLVHTFHFGNYPHTRPRIIWMERIFCRLADRLFSVGEVQRQQIRAVHHLPDGRIRTTWNGVTIPSGTGDPTFRGRIRAEGKLLVGTIATLIEQKGLRHLMTVARKIRDAGHDVKFVIVGEGHLRGELEGMRHQLGLDDTVELTGWLTNAAELALPTFDVFFQPSQWEAMSVVILEAMAAGKPVVATRVGENPHVIDDGVNGLLVEAGDVDAMAGALGRVLGDPELRQQLGCAARRKVQEHFTVEHMARAYEREYLDVLQ
jgi:glycosyltransferase involved in cell wall biosynthesis